VIFVTELNVSSILADTLLADTMGNIMYVYFLRAGNRGAIKIGMAKDVEARVAMLQTGNAFKLNILATIPCDSETQARHLESMFHKRFQSQRIRGEWFTGNINFQKLRDIEMEGQREKLFMDKEQESHDMQALASSPL